MKKGHLHLSTVTGNRDRKKTGILIVYMDEIDAVVRSESCEPQPLPMEQILRNGKGNPWAKGRKRRVGHDIALEWFHERNARILTATAAMRRLLVVGFRLKRDPKPLDTARITSLVEFNAGNADTGVVALRHQSWKQVKVSVRSTSHSRVQYAFDLLRIAWFRLHKHSQAMQLERDGQLSSRQATMASMTRFVS